MSGAHPRLQAFLEAAGGDLLVSADPALVRLLCGVTQDVETGPSPFAAPAVVVAPGDGPALLVISADEAPERDGVVAFEGFTVGTIDRAGALRDAVRTALARAGTRSGVLVDAATVPAAAGGLLGAARHAPPEIALVAAVKDAGDVETIAGAVRACDAGQAAARAATRVGATELELWQAARDAMERVAGGRVPVVADVVSGPRTLEVGGPPGARALAAGDAVLVDLVPRVDGLWGDSCATWIAGRAPTDVELAVHRTLRRALAAGLAALRPGVEAGAVDAAVRAVVAESGHDYPHHSGHGLGYAWHEEPRIVPGGRTPLEAGMVVALEPGVYADGIGMRLEQVAVVEPGGARVLSGHALGLET
jgi:Xaa-Pro aminopeptidase